MQRVTFSPSHLRVAIACLVLAGLAACSGGTAGTKDGEGKAAFSKKGGGAAPVRTVMIGTRTVPVEITAVGAVEPYATVAVRSQVAGTLTAVHFQEGQFVKQGELLFEIDARPYEEAIREADANLARSKATLGQAQANLERARTTVDLSNTQKARIEKLVSEGVFSREQLDNAVSDAKAKAADVEADRANVESARAAVGASEAALSRAKLDLTYTKIAAPMSGRTGNLSVKQGNLVRGTDAELVSILQLQPIYVTFAIPETQLPEERRRMQASKLQVTANIQGTVQDSAQGSVTFLDNAVDPTTGTIRLKGTFTNGDAKLWPGQFVNVQLRLSEMRDATVVPTAAVMNGQDGEYVFVVKQDQTVEQRPVAIALRGSGFAAISSGVAPGERVVVDGQVRLVPGSKVRVIS
jgi:multidrug efflux system membrane fusion protein